VTTTPGATSFSFRTRLTLQWIAAFGLLLAAAGLAIYLGARSYLTRELDRKVRTLARTEAASATDGAAGVHLHEPPIGSLREDEIAPKVAQVFDAKGQLVIESRELGQGVSLVPPEAIAAALDGAVPILTVTTRTGAARMAVVRAPSRQQMYAVAVGMYTAEDERFLRSLAGLLLGVWTVGLIATGAIGYALSSRALKPIEAITSRASRIARGDFSVRLDPPAIEDEIGRMTRALNGLLDRLYASLAANRRFAADASHELRGPVTAIAGEIDVTLRYPRDAATYRDALALVRERLGSMVAIIEDLTLLVRAEEGGREIALQAVPLGPFLEAARDRIAPLAAPRRIRLEVEDASRLVAYAEPRLLARALDNVLVNAVSYNRDDGHVHVRATFEDRGGETPSTIVITIRDGGEGIPAGEREHIFERFYRLDRSRARRTGGTGLGLAICREVLTVMHGSIRVAESGPTGTTMELRVPGAEPLEHDAGPEGGARTGRHESV
jgi:signal transduction histidine kinase